MFAKFALKPTVFYTTVHLSDLLITRKLSGSSVFVYKCERGWGRYFGMVVTLGWSLLLSFLSAAS